MVTRTGGFTVTQSFVSMFENLSDKEWDTQGFPYLEILRQHEMVLKLQ